MPQRNDSLIRVKAKFAGDASIALPPVEMLYVSEDPDFYYEPLSEGANLS